MGSVPIWFVTSTSRTRFQRKNNNSRTRIQNGKVIIIKATIYVALSIEISVFVEVIAPTYIVHQYTDTEMATRMQRMVTCCVTKGCEKHVSGWRTP